jgi:hypothetical protein
MGLKKSNQNKKRKPQTAKNNIKLSLEVDLISSKDIQYKVKAHTDFDNELYAALCNNRFEKDGQQWSCSWRYAGGIVAEIANQNKKKPLDSEYYKEDLWNMDYMQYYCNGDEGTITNRIEKELKKLGWTVVEEKEEDESTDI